MKIASAVNSPNNLIAIIDELKLTKKLIAIVKLVISIGRAAFLSVYLKEFSKKSDNIALL